MDPLRKYRNPQASLIYKLCPFFLQHPFSYPHTQEHLACCFFRLVYVMVGVSVQQQIFRLVRGKRSSYAPAPPTPPCQHPAMTLWKWITTITTSPFPHVQYTQRQTSGETDLWAYFSNFLLRPYIFIYHNILLIEKHSFIIIIIPNDLLGSLVSLASRILSVTKRKRMLEICCSNHNIS